MGFSLRIHERERENRGKRTVRVKVRVRVRVRASGPKALRLRRGRRADSVVWGKGQDLPKLKMDHFVMDRDESKVNGNLPASWPG